MNNRSRKKSGYADTKNYPHKNHPARYNRIGKNEIEYVTFTHHKKVNLKDKTYNTIPLTSNIDKRERKQTNKISYVFPKVYVGKRSALGKENNNYNLIDKDNNLVNDLFKTLPRESISYSSNSKKKF